MAVCTCRSGKLSRSGPIRAEDFAAYYQEYLPRLLNYMRLRTGDDELAHDLTAATFERAYARREQLRSDAAFAGWLFAIARNVLGEHFRRKKPQVSLDDLLDLPSQGESPEEAIARREALSDILAALKTLPERDQEILTLKFAAGLTNRAIASATGLGESNVAIIIYRAVRKLRAETRLG